MEFFANKLDFVSAALLVVSAEICWVVTKIQQKKIVDETEPPTENDNLWRTARIAARLMEGNQNCE